MLRISLACAAAIALPGCASEPERTAPVRMDVALEAQLVKEAGAAIISKYYDCVAVASVTAAKRKMPKNLIAEHSFSACNTEERALYSFYVSSYISPVEAETLVVKHKVFLKDEIARLTK